MISTIAQTIALQVAKNEPNYTNLVCNIFNSDEGMSILKAVRNNRYLIKCSIKVDEYSPELNTLKLIKKSIEFRIEENKFAKNGVKQNFKFFEELQKARLDHFQGKSFTLEG